MYLICQVLILHVLGLLIHLADKVLQLFQAFIPEHEIRGKAYASLLEYDLLRRAYDGGMNSFDTARADLSGHFAELFGLSLADDLAQSN